MWWDNLNPSGPKIWPSFKFRPALASLAIFLILCVILYITAVKEKLELPNNVDVASIEDFFYNSWHIVLFIIFSSIATFTAIYQAYIWLFHPKVIPEEILDFVEDGKRAFDSISIKIAQFEGFERDQDRHTNSKPTKNSKKQPILAHFVDHHVLRIRGLSGQNLMLKDALIEEAVTALALCLLSRRTVLIPAVSFFEGPLRKAIQTYFSRPLATGAISLVGDAQNIDEFLNLRMSEYPTASETFEIYRRAAEAEYEAARPFVGLPVNSTGQMRIGWQNRVERLDRIITSHGNSSNLRLLESVPEQMGGHAFVSQHALPILLKNRILLPENTLTDVLNGIFFDSLSDAADASLVYDLPFIGQPISALQKPAFSYREACLAMRIEGLTLSDLIPMDDHVSNDPHIERLSDLIAKAVDANDAH